MGLGPLRDPPPKQQRKGQSRDETRYTPSVPHTVTDTQDSSERGRNSPSYSFNSACIRCMHKGASDMPRLLRSPHFISYRGCAPVPGGHLHVVNGTRGSGSRERARTAAKELNPPDRTVPETARLLGTVGPLCRCHQGIRDLTVPIRQASILTASPLCSNLECQHPLQNVQAAQEHGVPGTTSIGSSHPEDSLVACANRVNIFSEDGFVQDAFYRGGSERRATTVTNTFQKQMQPREAAFEARAATITIRLTPKAIQELQGESPAKFAQLIRIIDEVYKRPVSTTTTTEPPATTIRVPRTQVQHILNGDAQQKAAAIDNLVERVIDKPVPRVTRSQTQRQNAPRRSARLNPGV